MSDIDLLKEEIVRSLGSVGIRTFYDTYCTNPLPQGNNSEGWTERTHCPIHNDTGTPNFFANVITGGFSCKACGEGGSIFDFWMLKNGYSIKDANGFKAALAYLANLARVDIAKWSKSKKSAKHIKGTESSSATNVPKLSKADQKDRSQEPVSPHVVERFSSQLNTKHVEYLLKNRGLKKKTIEKYRIGWDDEWIYAERGTGRDGKRKVWKKGRFTIPVQNAKGEFRNVRGYAPFADPQYKMANYIVNKGEPNEQAYGRPPRLFGLNFLVERADTIKHVVICEGEFDMMLLNQYFDVNGLDEWIAVTGTHGVKTFEAEWLPYLYNKNVYICFDVDEEGKLAAEDTATRFFLPGIKEGKFYSVKIIGLPLEGTKEMNDITDFFMKAGMQINDFTDLCMDTPALIPGGLELDEAAEPPIPVDNLILAVKDRRYIDRRIEVDITISGATSRVYHAIREYKISYCKRMADDDCCCQDAGEMTLTYGHPAFIACCMQTEERNKKTVAGLSCQLGECPKIDITKKVVMEEYYASQLVKRWRAEADEQGRMQNQQELVQVPVYILQPPDSVNIEPRNYRATGFVRTHPYTSIASLFIEKMESLEDDYKKFSVKNKADRELIETLKDNFTVDDIISQITHGVTHIYDADEILYAVLLTYLSPLAFFFNQQVQRGWLNTAVIGDSGTGKSATYIKLSDWLELGDIFSALSGTRTGLLYAIKQSRNGGDWHVQVGRYVQASGKIIAIDETQETHAEEIKRMAIAMDTGHLSVDQVASGGYNTQVRALFMMNPKSAHGKATTISDFVYGCEALRNCFHPMFIRRLDLAVFTSLRHDYEFFNKEAETEEGMTLTPTMMRALIYWAWTRKPNQIKFSEEATKLCLTKSSELAKVYGYADEVPLVSPQDFRQKLARLSAAFAILDTNFSDDLESVEIEPRHVESMCGYLDLVYSNTACNLRNYSANAKKKKTLEDYDKINKTFMELVDQARNSRNPFFRDNYHFLQLLLLMEQLEFARKRDLADQLGVLPRWVHATMAVLQGLNLVQIGRFGYFKTRKFNLFMQRWRKDGEVNNLLETAFSRIGQSALQDGNFELEHGTPDDEQDRIESANRAFEDSGGF